MTQNERDILENTLFRLSGINEEQLEAVIGRILPRVFPLLLREDPQTREVCQKVLDLILARSSSSTEPFKLPIVSLVQSVKSFDAPSKSLVLQYFEAFLQQGWRSLEEEEKIVVLEQLLGMVIDFDGFSGLTSGLLIEVLPRLTSLALKVVESNRKAFCSAEGRKEAKKRVFAPMENGIHLNWILSCFQKVLLGSSKEEKKVVVDFLKSEIFNEEEYTLLLLVASADSAHDVSQRSTDAMKRLGKAPIEVIYLDLMSLYFDPAAWNQLRLIILKEIRSSPQAAQSSPLCFKILLDSLVGPRTFPHLQLIGLEFLQTFLSHSPIIPPQFIAILFSKLVVVLKNLCRDQAPQRNMFYEPISDICVCCPFLVQNNIEIVKFFFQRLKLEPSTQSISQALHKLSKCYINSSDEVKSQLRIFLVHASEEDVSKLKLCSLQWMSQCFPFHDIQIRFLSCLSVGSMDVSIRSMASKCLRPSSGDDTYPLFEAFLSYARTCMNESPLTGESFKSVTQFALKCLLFRKNNSAISLQSIHDFVQVLFSSLEQPDESSSQLHLSSIRLISKVFEFSFQKELSCELTDVQLDHLKRFLFSGSREIQKSAAQALGLWAQNSSQEKVSNLLQSLIPHVLSSDSKETSSVYGSILASAEIIAHVNKSALSEKQVKEFVDRSFKLLHASDFFVVFAAIEFIKKVAPTLDIYAFEGSIFDVISKLFRLVQESSDTERKPCCYEAIAAVFSANLSVKNSPEMLRSVNFAIEKLEHSQIRSEEELMLQGYCLAAVLSSKVECSVPSSSSLLLLKLAEYLSSMEKSSVLSMKRCVATCLFTLLSHSKDQDLDSRSKIASILIAQIDNETDLTRELACKGVVLLFEKSSIEEKEFLTQTVIQLLPRNPRLRHFIDIAKDIASPLMLYNLIDLSLSHPVWSTTKGVLFQIDSVYDISQHFTRSSKVLYPKLYLYKYDPDPIVRKTIENIWDLVDDSKDAVKKYQKDILVELVFSGSQIQTKRRQSACLALRNFLPIISVYTLLPYVEQLWSLTFNFLDDIDETIRLSSIALGKQMVKVFERLCEHAHESGSELSLALKESMPFLLEKGIPHKVPQIQSFVLECLDLLCLGGNLFLRPYYVDIIGILLESLSSIEPKELSYAMFHTASFNVSVDQLEQARLSFGRSSKHNEILQRFLEKIEIQDIPPLVEVILDMVRTNVGLISLDACKRATEFLVKTFGEFMEGHSKRLLKAYQGGIGHSSATVGRIYIEAIGSLCLVAKEKHIVGIISHFSSKFEDDDDDRRSRALDAVGHIALKVHRAEVMKFAIPVVLLGLYDENKSIQDHSQKIFDDISSGLTTDLLKHLDSVLESVRHWIVSPIFKIRKSCFALIGKICTTLPGNSLILSNITEWLEKLKFSLEGPYWTGKSALFSCLVQVCRYDPSRMLKEQNVCLSVCSALLDQSSKGELVIRIEALESFGNLIKDFEFCRNTFSVSSKTISVLRGILLEFSDPQTITKPQRQFLCILFGTLQELIPSDLSIQYDASQWILPLFVKAFVGFHYQIRESALWGAASLLEQISNKSALPKTCLDELVQKCHLSLLDSKHASVRCAALGVLYSLAKSISLKSMLSSIHEELKEITQKLTRDSNSGVVMGAKKLISLL